MNAKSGGGGLSGRSSSNPNASTMKPKGSPGMIVKPKSLVCYICGREFGTASLEIHLKTCKKKWEWEQQQKPKHERKPCPQPPKNFDDIIAGKGGAQASYNEEALDSYNNKALDPCPNCGRTFLPDRLKVHLRSCGGANGTSKARHADAGSAQASPSPPKPKAIVRPRTLVCYICGREFGTASLEIHIKTCKKKWEYNQNQLPLKDRRPLPEPPKNWDAALSGAKSGSYNLEEFNANQMDQFNDKALIPCPDCGRTFLPERLPLHAKGCKGPRKPLG